jgi:hypothetical protein
MISAPVRSGPGRSVTSSSWSHRLQFSRLRTELSATRTRFGTDPSCPTDLLSAEEEQYAVGPAQLVTTSRPFVSLHQGADGLPFDRLGRLINAQREPLLRIRRYSSSRDGLAIVAVSTMSQPRVSRSSEVEFAGNNGCRRAKLSLTSESPSRLSDSLANVGTCPRYPRIRKTRLVAASPC